MADGILGLGSAGSTGLSNELIDTLKNAERKAQVEPIETRITDWDTEVEQFGEIESKINELLNISKSFDLFSTTANTFEQVYASTTGTAVAFEASDTSNLKPGTIDVEVTQIAKKDVFQSSVIVDKDTPLVGGALSVTVGGETYNFDATGKTYEQLVETMNYNTKLDVGLEKVSDNEYRVIVKSAQSGTGNALTIEQTGGLNLGFGGSVYQSGATITASNVPLAGEEVTFNVSGVDHTFTADGLKTYADMVQEINDASIGLTASFVNGRVEVSSDDGTAITITSDTLLGLNERSQTQVAQNMLVNVDGIDYNLSSNQVVLQNGLTISALEEGTASISIQRDSTSIEINLNELITQYNELVDMVSQYTGADSKIEDKSTLRSILSDVKDIIFGSDYGTDNNKSIFNYGMELDKSGHLSLNSTVFNKALVDNPDDITTLFLGVAEDRGIGTKLKEYLDELDSFEGLLTTYGDNMTTRKESLEEQKTKAIEALDSKYAQLAAQFSAYTSIISQFENSFNGLKMMIQQSVASN